MMEKSPGLKCNANVLGTLIAPKSRERRYGEKQENKKKKKRKKKKKKNSLVFSSKRSR